MRAATPASLTLCVLFSGLFGLSGVSGCTKTTADTKLPEPQAGPGNDSCAVYVERVASGVRCQAIDASRCSCELVASAGATPSGDAPLLPTDSGTITAPGPSPQNPHPAGHAATLVFAPGPANATVKCLSGPCPVTTAEVLTVPYPAISADPKGTSVQLEFSAPDYKSVVNTYTLYPGTNQIGFTLEKPVIAPPDSATVEFQGAPDGATVECVSGPCPDKKVHTADKSFPAIKLDKDDQTLLLRFNAPGYRTAMTSFQVKRGPNIIPVLMERKPAGK
jgi:hypothetical protein